jgi:hypothetical protein
MMAKRVQVQKLQQDTQVRPTAQIVDTYTRPESPVADNTLEMLASALSKLTPGIATKAGEQEKKEQMALGERERMREAASGYKLQRDNIMAGNENLQDSPIALKHLQVLRAQAFVDEQLSALNTQLFTTGMKDQNGNIVEIGSREQLNQIMYGRISDLTNSFDAEDEFIMSAVAPKIKEWQHNTVAKWEADFNDKLKSERENLYAVGLGNIFKNRQGKSTAMVIQELTAAVDSHYRLGNSKATETFVKQIAALADANDDVSIIDTALAVKPGGRNLTPTQLETLIEAREKVQNDIKTKQDHALKVQTAQRKKAKEDSKADAFTYLQENGATADVESEEFKEILARHAANGGDAIALKKSSRTMIENFYKTKTPANTQALDLAKVALKQAAMDPSRQESLELMVQELFVQGSTEGPLRPGMTFTRNLHPSDLTELRKYAAGLDKSNNYLSNADVNRARKAYVGLTVGNKSQFSDIDQEHSKKVRDKEQEFNDRLTERLTSAYIESNGTLTDSQVRQISSQVVDELTQEEQMAQDPEVFLNEQRVTASKKSLKAWNQGPEDWLLADDLNDMYVPEEFEGMDKNQLQQLQEDFTSAYTDPLAVVEGPNGQQMEQWQAFDAVYFPGAYAFYSKKYKNIIFE